MIKTVQLTPLHLHITLQKNIEKKHTLKYIEYPNIKIILTTITYKINNQQNNINNTKTIPTKSKNHKTQLEKGIWQSQKLENTNSKIEFCKLEKGNFKQKKRK